MALARIYKRLVVAMRVNGWSGRLVGKRVRYPSIPDDQVFGRTPRKKRSQS